MRGLWPKSEERLCPPNTRPVEKRVEVEVTCAQSWTAPEDMAVNWWDWQVGDARILSCVKSVP